MISRQGRGGGREWEGKDEHPADRKLKVYRCFSISIAAAFQGRAAFPSINYFADASRRSLPRNTTPPPLARNSNRSRTYYSTLIQDGYRHTFERATRIKRTRSTCKRFVRFPGRRGERKKKRKTTLFSVFLSVSSRVRRIRFLPEGKNLEENGRAERWYNDLQTNGRSR